MNPVLTETDSSEYSSFVEFQGHKKLSAVPEIQTEQLYSESPE